MNKKFPITPLILLNCPRLRPFHSTPGSEYLQPPFRSYSKTETNDKCLTGISLP